MKDLFSLQSEAYRQFRPTYPQELYNFVLKQIEGRERAWDCGTGNGQVAAELADHFQEIEATDISENQLKNAITRENIYYKLKPAEQSDYEEESFDLITVAQALHWFNFDEFYAEVRRVAKQKAILAVWGYGLLKITTKADPIMEQFYSDTVGPYWDEERQHIDNGYSTIPFPFKEIAVKQKFVIKKRWTLKELQGYISTWSAVQKYQQDKNMDPVPQLIESLKPVWPPDEVKEVLFPIFLRLGRIE